MVRCSVIIPAFNAERYVGKAVESALAQTLSDVEIIVVNDGSTDTTPEVMESFGSRITGIHQENAGPSAARNAGLKSASGEFVAFLDADDLWFARRLELMVGRLADDPGLGFVTSDAYLMEEDIPTAHRYYGTLVDSSPFNSGEPAYWIVRQNYIFTGVVARNALFDRHGTFRPGILAEDWELWTRFVVGGERVALVNRPLGYYRVRSDGLTCSAGFQSQVEATQLLALGDPAVQRIPRLGRDVYLPRGLEALAKRDSRRAAMYLAAASRDATLPAQSRLLCAAGATAPGLAVRAMGYRQSRLERRPGATTFFLEAGCLRDGDGRTFEWDERSIDGNVESDGSSRPVSGWAVGGRKHCPVDRVAVFVDGQFRFTATPCEPREDVAVYTGTPESLNCGFRLPQEAGLVSSDEQLQVIAIKGRRCRYLPGIGN